MEKKQLRIIFLYWVTKQRKQVATLTTNKRTIQRWFQKFRNRDETLEDDEGQRRKMAINSNRLKILVKTNPHTTVRLLHKQIELTKNPKQSRVIRLVLNKKFH